ncbi:hypothetical protein PR048_008306 [Dryococelus australis]|uniref:Uncharacterized protein n=1 Tax=Dryococelus australis TaxID=614101 RepID=A0ABQ9HWQ5_9NEOP|nr:hypothetical protein PR048_008306 [Dryococelus australis]
MLPSCALGGCESLLGGLLHFRGANFEYCGSPAGKTNLNRLLFGNGRNVVTAAALGRGVPHHQCRRAPYQWRWPPYWFSKERGLEEEHTHLKTNVYTRSALTSHRICNIYDSRDVTKAVQCWDTERLVLRSQRDTVALPMFTLQYSQISHHGPQKRSKLLRELGTGNCLYLEHKINAIYSSPAFARSDDGKPQDGQTRNQNRVLMKVSLVSSPLHLTRCEYDNMDMLHGNVCLHLAEGYKTGRQVDIQQNYEKVASNGEWTIAAYKACPRVRKLLYLEPDPSRGGWIVTYTGAEIPAENGYENCYGNGNGHCVGLALTTRKGGAGKAALLLLESKIIYKGLVSCIPEKHLCIANDDIVTSNIVVQLHFKIGRFSWTFLFWVFLVCLIVILGSEILGKTMAAVNLDEYYLSFGFAPNIGIGLHVDVVPEVVSSLVGGICSDNDFQQCPSQLKKELNDVITPRIGKCDCLLPNSRHSGK